MACEKVGSPEITSVRSQEVDGASLPIQLGFILGQTYLSWRFQIFLFCTLLGEMIQFDYSHIFQMG